MDSNSDSRFSRLPGDKIHSPDSEIVAQAHRKSKNRIVRQTIQSFPEQLHLPLAEETNATVEAIEKALSERSIVKTNDFTELNYKRKGIARAAYLANPSRCLWCEEHIPLKENEKPHRRKHQKFCSHSHAGLFRNRRRREADEAKYYENPNHCDHCGVVIRIAPREKIRDAKAKRFCSREHAASFYNTPKRNKSIEEYNEQPNHCMQCGKAISVKRKITVALTRERKFCHYPSPCAASYNENMKKTRREERPCQKCGENFKHAHKSRKFCRKCSMLDFRIDRYVNNKSGLTYHARWVILKDVLQGKLVKECKKCKRTSAVDVCHIKDVNRFPKDATLREVNARENLVYLCKNHHYDFDCIEAMEDKLLWLEGC